MLEFVKKEEDLLKHQLQPPQQGLLNSNPTSSSVPLLGNYHVCQSCKVQITSRWLFKMFSCSEDTYFHEECLVCSVCNIQLNTTCYFRNEKLYCKYDYNRLFNINEQRILSKTCSKCSEMIQTNELVMKIEKSHIYHLHCFTCTICCTQLQKGDEFVLRGNQLFCRADYEKEQQQLFLFQSQQLSPRGDENNRPRDGRRGPKRPRTILTSSQRRQFKASFEVSPKPCRKVREGLAKETGLSVRVVQVWFQNQRAKMKKIQRKNGNKPEDSSKENKDDKRKRGGGDDSSSEDDEDCASRSCYDTDSQHGSYTPGGCLQQPRNPNLPYSPDDYNSNDESFICSSEISFEEDSNTGLENAEHLSGTGGTTAAPTSGTSLLELHSLSGPQPPNSRPAGSAPQDPTASSTATPGMYHPLPSHHGHGHHHHHHHGIPSSQPSSSSPYGATHPQQQPSINPIDKLYLMQNSYFNNANNE